MSDRLPGEGDEEARYRRTAALDAASPAARAALLDALSDPSWRVRSAAADRLGAAAEPAVLRTLFALVISAPTIGARDAAGAAIARIGAPAVALLVDRLSDPVADVRQAAATLLGSVGDRRAAVPLTSRLADPDANVRTAAAEALGKIGGPDATAALRAALDSDDALLRLASLEALGALGSCPANVAFQPLLQDRTLRRPAYRLLGSCDDPAALALLAAGAADPSQSVRDAALGAIGRQRSRRGVEELAPLAAALRAAAEAGGRVADGCADALAAEDAPVAVGALTALAWIGAPRHVCAVLALAEDERYRTLVEEVLEALPPGPPLKEALAAALPELGPLARITALATLARLGSPAALESLSREASDPEAFTQADAIAALGRVGDARAVPPLAGLLGDEAPAVASVAATALTRIAEQSLEARAAAVAELRARAGASPSAALYRALGATGGAEDLTAVRRGIGSASVVQRIAAAGALATLAHRGHVPGASCPELAGALRDGAWSVRAAAARAFAAVARACGARGEGAPATCADALDALRVALRDPEPSVRAAAAEALGASRRADTAGAIAALADDPGAPPLVVVSALQALLSLGPPPRDVVERAAGHADPEVVKEAVHAAARLPGEEGLRVLRAAAGSARWDVRRAAARAMAERGDGALAAEAARLGASDPDPLVARAFAEAAQALQGR